MPVVSSQHMTSTTFSTRSEVQVPAVTTDRKPYTLTRDSSPHEHEPGERQ